jgi:hypothetical protein
MEDKTKFKFLNYGKYLDDINWEAEILHYIDLVLDCNHSTLKCEQFSVNYLSTRIKKKKDYIINESSQEELILLAKDYFQWIITDKLSKNSPHIKKLFKLVFYPKPIHPYIFYFEPGDIYDYDYINTICEAIEDTAYNMINKLDYEVT